MKTESYLKSPLEIIKEIPCFSKYDFYIANYQVISDDHLAHLKETGKNPFMNEEHWLEVENSTAELLKKYCKEGINILDVGVGMGRLLERFPECHRSGMDISLAYLEHAKARGIDVCMSRVEDMPYRTEFFDVVVSTDVLEHVLDLNLAFSKIMSVLKPGGILICRVPYRESLAGYLTENFPYDLVHLRSFDEFSIQMLVEKIFNLRLVEWNVSGFIGGNPKLILPIPKFNSLVRMVLRISKFMGKSVHQNVCRLVNNPSEINFVVKNEAYKTRN